jgi:hypothetical protein
MISYHVGSNPVTSTNAVRLRSLAEIAVNAYEYGSIPFALYEIGERRLCFENINLDRIN